MESKAKYLDFYIKCMETGEMPYKCSKHSYGGLCGIFGDDVMELFTPTERDRKEYTTWSFGWFAYDGEQGCRLATYFGPTRQTIVLFLAAMNDEL